MAAHFLPPASGQERDQPLLGPHAQRRLRGEVPFRLGLQRSRGVADPCRPRASAGQQFHLEPEEEKGEVHILAHPAYAFSAPCPDLRADVVDHAPSQALGGVRQPQMEPGRIDGKEDGVGMIAHEAQDRVPRAADFGKLSQERGEPHDGDGFHRDQGLKSCRAEPGPADPRRFRRDAARAQGLEEVRAQTVSRRLARRDDEEGAAQTGRSRGRLRAACARTSSATRSASSATSVSSHEPSGSRVRARKWVSSDSSGSRGSTVT